MQAGRAETQWSRPGWFCFLFADYRFDPVGWVSAVVAASAAATVVVSEQAALLAILGAGWEGKRVRPLEALRFAARQVWPLLQFTARCLERRVIDLVERHEMEKEIVLMSLKSESVRRAKALRPDWKVGLLTRVAIGNLALLDVDFLAVHVGLADRSLIQSAHESGKEVAVWTVNDPITISTLISRGVDNLITDKPALARKVLSTRAELSSAERLLIEIAGLLGGTPE